MGEFVAARCAEILRMRQVWARSAAHERQVAVNEFLCQLGGTQPVRSVRTLPVGPVLILQKVTHKSRVVKYDPVPGGILPANATTTSRSLSRKSPPLPLAF